MKAFNELKYRGRAARLRQLALNALKEYDLDVTKVSLITIDTNGVFRVDTADKAKYVVRVTDPFGGHDLVDTQLELQWMRAIQLETDIPISEPVPAKDGRLVVTASTEGVPEARNCVVFKWVPGVNLEDRMSEEIVEKMGALSARLHQHGKTFQIPSGTPTRKLDKIFAYSEPGFALVEPMRLWDDEFAEMMTDEGRKVFEMAIEQVEAELANMYADSSRVQILHHDLHIWNVMVSRGKLYAIDFEDLILGLPEQDIATTLYYFPWEDFDKWKKAFQRGYEKVQPYPIRDDHHLETMIVARRLLLVNDMLNLDVPEWREKLPRVFERTIAHLQRYLVGEVTGNETN